jgi:hypothetical protein
MLISNLRQFWYPREFRIASMPWPQNLESLMIKIVQSMEEAKTKVGKVNDEEIAALFANIGTGLWRIRQKMTRPGTSKPLDGMERPYRHFESVWDVVKQAGVEIRDYGDEPFVSGMSLNVVAFQPMPGLERERILETIKPTVYYKGKPIQMGDVVVGTPEKQPGATSSNR